MKWVYRILRSVILFAIALAVLVPSGLFVALSVPGVQRDIRLRAERELSELLDMTVTIGDVNVAPFSRMALRRVAVMDQNGDTAVAADRIGAGLSLAALVWKHRLVVNYTELIGVDMKLHRDSAGAPLNIQPMLDALAPKDASKPPKRFDFKVNTVVVRTSSFCYDVDSEPILADRFDKNHIRVADLRADLRIPECANDSFNVMLRRLAFTERSGFEVKSIEGEFIIGSRRAEANNVKISFNGSEISLQPSSIEYDSIKSIGKSLSLSVFSTGITKGSQLRLSSLAPFIPVLNGRDIILSMSGGVSGNNGRITLDGLDLSADNRTVWLEADGTLSHADAPLDSMIISLPTLSISAKGCQLTDMIRKLGDRPIAANLSRMIENLGDIELLGEASGSMLRLNSSAIVLTDAGRIDVAARMTRKRDNDYLVQGEVSLPDLDGVKLVGGIGGILSKLGRVSASVSTEMNFIDRKPIGYCTLNITEADFNRRHYTDMFATLNIDGKYLGVSSESRNEGLDFNLDAEADIGIETISLSATCDVRQFDLALAGTGNASGRVLSGRMQIFGEGSGIDDLQGKVALSNIYMTGTSRPVDIKEIEVTASLDSAMYRSVRLRSDLIDADINGQFTPAGLVHEVHRMLSATLPSLIKNPRAITADETDDFAEISFTIKSTESIGDAISLPVSVIYPVEGRGRIDYASSGLNINIDAPYLQQKGKLLENTQFMVNLSSDSLAGRANVYVTTVLPTKKGNMTLSAQAYATDDRVDSRFDWRVDRERGFYGDIDLSADFMRQDADDGLSMLLHVNPTELVFNDTVWQVDPATIYIADKRVCINDFRIGRQGQYISINGCAGAEPDDSVVVSLRDVNLDYVFETLDIQTAMFGGVASGNVYAIAALGSNPRMYTDRMDVAHLSYNHSLMGDTRINSDWDNVSHAVNIRAEIRQPNGCRSKIDGRIMPLSDSLDFNFDADKIEVGFMLPFMEAFTSEVSGYASGKARLWGSFKYIDMVGDIYAEDLKLKLDFTNTAYYATDSVHLRPGYIDLKNIHLRDVNGHTALLNGWLRHEYFKKPRFRFNITEARDMLVYDVRESSDTKWFGRIYGNGSATVSGQPGLVEIGVNMQTAANSTFTFVLSDIENAYDYNFITFRDRDQARKDSIAASTAPPAVIRELKERIARSDDGGEPSIYKMNIAVDVTPSALVTLVMDPVGGDRIRANGNGNMRMTYDSANEDLRMFGTYTLIRGSYNFTLQDIIIKDFTIRDGSSITFTGDPFAAQLNIKAAYSLNANLSDLDESFLQDKELNRTNVPVNALLNVDGDMRQPDISFDLEFPTLTQDTYRKVRSIVSTEDMMNRQIIYLLALNRFYTPDYMTTTKGNEFVSVASSTISSQLGSILGQLSDNWSIAPAVRSDRGDFSDVEVDLALSSNLLNNRLILNGNFGYRDKSLNSNSFVGDFDIEYLLNRRGTVRLKAYNRYNDRNYYLRSALTTQGVGVVFKRDFDNIFSFLRRKKRNNTEESKSSTVEQPDSLQVPTDSTAIAVPTELPGL